MEMNVNGLDQVKIAELADLLRVSARTIRCYEEIGLLNSVKRAEGGKRIYTDSDVKRLKFIKRLKHLSCPSLRCTNCSTSTKFTEQTRMCFCDCWNFWTLMGVRFTREYRISCA